MASRGLDWAYLRLRSTGRGKHVVQFSYYHVDLIAQVQDVAQSIAAIRQQLDEPRFDFNVVKLSKSRLSFLRYEDFSVPFPALLTSRSCDVVRGTCRLTDYSHRRNPPILHRKELLLPTNHPLVPRAIQLTKHLESLGAFKSPSTIGTRNGWLARLESLGLTLHVGEVVLSE